METGIVRCKECSEKFDTRRSINDSLLKHIISFNHIEYLIASDEEAKEKPFCCHYCGNVNFLVLGHCSSNSYTVCINCLSNYNVFSSYGEWHQACCSWYPYALNYQIFNLLPDVCKVENIEFDKNVKSYALALNQFYLSSLNSLLNQSKGLRFSSEYKVLRSGKRNTTIVVTIPYRLDRRIYPSMCVMVSFGKNVQYEGVITFRRDNGDAFITLLECYNFAYDSGY